MENYFEHIGKAIVAIDVAQKVGYVLNLCFDEDAILNGYIAVDDESENEFFVSLDSILAAGECILIESASNLQPFAKVSCNPLNKQIYATDGTNLGKVSHITLVGKKIDKIITEKCEIKPRHILSQSDEIIIFKKNKKNAKKIKKISQKIINLPKIEIMTMSNKPAQPFSPSKVTMSAKMLLNKQVTNDIFGLNNELIAKKDEIITQKTIEKAKKHNKINYLIFNCK